MAGDVSFDLVPSHEHQRPERFEARRVPELLQVPLRPAARSRAVNLDGACGPPRESGVPSAVIARATTFAASPLASIVVPSLDCEEQATLFATAPRPAATLGYGR